MVRSDSNERTMLMGDSLLGSIPTELGELSRLVSGLGLFSNRLDGRLSWVIFAAMIFT